MSFPTYSVHVHLRTILLLNVFGAKIEHECLHDQQFPMGGGTERHGFVNGSL